MPGWVGLGVKPNTTRVFWFLGFRTRRVWFLVGFGFWVLGLISLVFWFNPLVDGFCVVTYFSTNLYNLKNETNPTAYIKETKNTNSTPTQNQKYVAKKYTTTKFKNN